MPTRTSVQSVFADRLQAISRWASVATIALGCLVLIGWLLDVPIFKSLLPGMNAMKANTALGFVLCGLALWLLQHRPTPNAMATYAALACAGLVTAIGLATLSQYAFGWDLHIDQLLFVDTTPTYIRAFPGRMVPATAVIFALFGVALLTVRHLKLYKLAEWATLGASLIALAAFIGLLYDVGDPSNLYLVTIYRGIALHTVVGAIIISIGLLCLKPDQGLISMFVRDTPGGDMARRLLPMVIGLPLLVGLLRQTGERMGLYPAEFGMALNTIIPIGALVILIWQSARALDRSEFTRRQSEQALRENEDKFRYVFDYSPVAKSITRPSGEIEVNQAFCDMLGYSQEELQGEVWSKITHPDDVQTSQQLVASVMSGETRSIQLSKRYIHKNGAAVWTEVNSTLRRDGEGCPLYFLTSVIDVTERKQAESAILKMQTLLNETQEITKIGGWEYDVAAKRVFWTDEVYRIHGVSKEYDPGDPLQDIKFCESEDQRKIDEAFARAIADGTHYDLELRLIKASGEKIWVRTRGRAEKSDGKTVRIFGNIMDITERKQAEEQLRKSEERFRTMFDNMLEGAQFLGFDWRYLYINKSAEEHNRRPNQELLGNIYMDMWPGIESTHVFAMIKRCMTERVSCRMENEFIYPNGFKGWFELIIQPASEGVVIFSSDITERKHAEERFQLAIESAPNAVIMVDQHGQMMLVNSQTENYFGYARSELFGQDMDKLVPERFRMGHANHRFEFFAQPQARSMGVGRDLYGLRKDGTEFPVEIGLAPIATQQGMLVIATIVDITERKRAEQARDVYTRKLEQSNRDLQEFAYVASHDLQEPLRKVQAFSNRLASKYADAFDETGRDYLNRMRDASQRMQVLINDLLTLSRVSTHAQPFSDVDLNLLAQEVLSNLENQVERSNGRVEIGELPKIEADPTQIRQLLQNLIGNALKFHLQERPPLIKVSAKVEGVTCQISVEDNGIGFDPQYLDRIFKPFQRLHSREEYEGSGMGLAICRRIVEHHGGAITATSVPGKGATFILTLPVHQPEEKNDAKA